MKQPAASALFSDFWILLREFWGTSEFPLNLELATLNYFKSDRDKSQRADLHSSYNPVILKILVQTTTGSHPNPYSVPDGTPADCW